MDVMISLFRLMIAVLSGLGVYLNFKEVKGMNRRQQFIFYTNLSNLVIFIAYTIILSMNIGQFIRQGQWLTFFPDDTLMGALALMIIVTGLIFNLMIKPRMSEAHDTILNSMANRLTHNIVPLLVFVEWLLFEEKNNLSLWSPLVWLIIPLLYWLFTIIRAHWGSPIQMSKKQVRYPYFFIDPDQYGWKRVLMNVAVLVILFAALGYILYGVSRVLPLNDVIKTFF